MAIQPTLYNILLLTAALINISASVILLMQAALMSFNRAYRRALVLTALTLLLFGAGFALHLHFQWRTSAPQLATALSLTYFHAGAVCFSWSHTGLVSPSYPSWRFVLRDMAILAICITLYWVCLGNLGNVGDLGYLGSLVAYAIALCHCTWLALTFYRRYFYLRRHLPRVQADRRVSRHIRFMLLSVHLIVAFGIGSMIITAAANVPSSLFNLQCSMFNAQWPFTLLMAFAIPVFGYIAWSLTCYRDVVDYCEMSIWSVEYRKHTK